MLQFICVRLDWYKSKCHSGWSSLKSTTEFAWQKQCSCVSGKSNNVYRLHFSRGRKVNFKKRFAGCFISTWFKIKSTGMISCSDRNSRKSKSTLSTWSLDCFSSSPPPSLHRNKRQTTLTFSQVCHIIHFHANVLKCNKNIWLLC